MSRRRRTARAATTAAVAVLAGSATLGMPGVAHGEDRIVRCGETVEAAPGDKVVARLVSGVTVTLGEVTESTTVLKHVLNPVLGTLCQVTVKVVEPVDDAAGQVGDAAPPVKRAVEGTVSGVTDTAGRVVDGVAEAVTGSGDAGNEPRPASPPRSDPAPPHRESAPGPGGSGNTGPWYVSSSNSPVLGGFTLPTGALLPASFSTGWAPMRDYSGIPVAAPGRYAPSPSIRYGGQVPGYSPEFGILGESTQSPSGNNSMRSAGDASPLPDDGRGWPSGAFGTAGLPTLLAVLALAGVTAALVRTWVLRRTTS